MSSEHAQKWIASINVLGILAKAGEFSRFVEIVGGGGFASEQARKAIEECLASVARVKSASNADLLGARKGLEQMRAAVEEGAWDLLPKLGAEVLNALGIKTD